MVLNLLYKKFTVFCSPLAPYPVGKKPGIVFGEPFGDESYKELFRGIFQTAFIAYFLIRRLSAKHAFPRFIKAFPAYRTALVNGRAADVPEMLQNVIHFSRPIKNMPVRAYIHLTNPPFYAII